MFDFSGKQNQRKFQLKNLAVWNEVINFYFRLRWLLTRLVYCIVEWNLIAGTILYSRVQYCMQFKMLYGEKVKSISMKNQVCWSDKFQYVNVPPHWQIYVFGNPKPQNFSHSSGVILNRFVKPLPYNSYIVPLSVCITIIYWSDRIIADWIKSYQLWASTD